MAEEGQPTDKQEKKILTQNYVGAFFGVVIGGLGGTMVFGSALNNAPLAAAIGTVIGGVIGFGAPHVFRMIRAH
jgi:outer membrane lipoprotein SlyB